MAARVIKEERLRLGNGDFIPVPLAAAIHAGPDYTTAASGKSLIIRDH